MTYTVYEILNGRAPVTNLMENPLDDLDTAKRLAREISAGLPEDTISVCARVRSPDGSATSGAFTGEWSGGPPTAVFLNGQEISPDDL